MRAAILDAGGVVSQVILVHEDADPAEFGAIACPEDVAIGWRREGGTFVAPPPLPEPAEDDVPAAIDRERDRRIDAGLIFKGTLFQTRPQDRENIAGAAQLATLALLLGGKQPGDLLWHEGVAPFAWIADDNSLVTMDAPTVIAFGKAAAARKSELIYAGRALKDRIAAGETISDLTDDALWPA